MGIRAHDRHLLVLRLHSAETRKVSAYVRFDGESCIGGVGMSLRNLLTNIMLYVKNDDFLDHRIVSTELEQFVRDYVKYF